MPQWHPFALQGTDPSQWNVQAAVTQVLAQESAENYRWWEEPITGLDTTATEIAEVFNDDQTGYGTESPTWVPQSPTYRNQTVSEPLVNRCLTVSEPLANRNQTDSRPVVDQYSGSTTPIPHHNQVEPQPVASTVRQGSVSAPLPVYSDPPSYNIFDPQYTIIVDSSSDIGNN